MRLGHGFIVCGDGAAFSASSKILAGIKAEGRGHSDRAGTFPPVILLGEILRAVRLAGIFNHEQVVFLRQFQDWIHVGRLPVQMHGNDASDAPLRAAFDQSSS